MTSPDATPEPSLEGLMALVDKLRETPDYPPWKREDRAAVEAYARRLCAPSGDAAGLAAECHRLVREFDVAVYRAAIEEVCAGGKAIAVAEYESARKSLHAAIDRLAALCAPAVPTQQPDLLAALQDLFEADMEHVLMGDGKDDQIEAIAKGRAAIAKATGGVA